MKKIAALLMVVLLLLCSCSSKYHTDITPEEIVAVYEVAGFNVSSHTYDEVLEYGQTGYVRADHPDGGYIYFTVFETDEDAKAYKKDFYHPGMMGLFSVIFGDPSWQRWEVYGCVVAEYDNPDFFEPFEELLKNP